MHDLDKSRLLSKLISEELNTAEKQRLDEWLSQSPENTSEKETFEKLWEMSGKYEPSFEPNVEKSFAQFKTKIEQESDRYNSPKIIRMRPGRLLVRVAAVFLLLIAATFLIKPNLFELSNGDVIYASAEKIEATDLTDGTKIWLNKNAQLAYAKDYNESSRKVSLKGEGYFDIAHNPEKPFQITTENSRVSILGTSFNLRDENGYVYLDVNTGLVSFESLNSNKKVTVKAGESAIYNAASDSFSQFASPTANADAWVDNKFSFNATELHLVFAELSRYYNVDFQIENQSLENCLFTSGEFQNESLDNILEVLEGAFSISISKEKELYKVKGSHCN